MQTAPIISYSNIDPSPDVADLVNRRIAVLERISDDLTGCDVTLDAPQKRKLHGRVIRVHLNVHVPGPDFSVSREVAQGSARDDLILAVNRAFSAAEKHLKRHKKKMAAVEVKHHAPVLHGKISLLEPELGYGYVQADDGREVYFQRDSFTSDVWDSLEKDVRLRFREQEGEKGPFAVAVSVAK
ncbi:HPF/RaiA family ribosome-associated protein [Puniceibacterium sediminis]|uniref:Ribosome-associated translation inhibitor RaiA n=1 Tax=Puniceibacterium sediminis TaxID=1608407 RepID=A0A238W6T4_9RHOB|nr:HPF/RaiA family ribosome-associated protein [Puniceibacterium sediminis]SNR41903.1 Ribosome-associated translation inhibitor RaiA [Puniceibacterium sediminis]